MRNVRVTGRGLMLVGALLALASAEAAQRTFVASTGNDANPCSLAQPCRGFAAALNQTDVGGEIVVIDSAGYGVFTTDRSVSVIAPPGVHAGVSVFSTFNGITVDGPVAKVVLRGLSINGQGGAIGIWMRNGTELHVENCMISGLETGLQADAGKTSIKETIVRGNSDNGIVINDAPSVQLDGVLVRDNYNGLDIHGLAGITQVSIRNTVVTRNDVHGVYVGAGGTSLVVVDLDTVEISANSWALTTAGLFVTVGVSAKAEVTLARSIIARNKTSGMSVTTQPGGVAHVSVSDSTITGNYGDGIWGFGAGTTLLASNNTLTRNSDFAFNNAGGGTLFYSRNNNTIQSNFGGATSGTISALSPL